MAGFIPDNVIDEVRGAADIVEVVSNYVNLTRSGGVYRGLCPFHAEKTPSFTVNPGRRIFHCFGCGVGGNVFRFLMLQKGISFPEAVAELAERHGIELPRIDSGRIREQKGRKISLYKAVDLARDFFREELAGPGGRTAREYLDRRGLGGPLVDEFQLGWAPPGWESLRMYLESKKVPTELMAQAGLVKQRADGRSHYDTFRARVICPISDLDGRTVGFGGRLLENDERQPKYINSPETPIYSKGRLLYGLDRNRVRIRDSRRVLIVEGYFDLLSLAAHGVRNTAATLGTALTAAHLRLLKGYVDEVVLVFDADPAGRAAAARALPLFMAAGLEARVLVLPDGRDPDDFVRESGPAALEELIEKAGSLLKYYLDQVLARHPDTLAGKSQATKEVLEVISGVENPADQDLLRGAAAERLGVSEKALMLSQRRRPQKRPEPAPQGTAPSAVGFEIEMLRLVLLHPETAERITGADLGPLFVDKTAKKVYEAMAREFSRAGVLDHSRLMESLADEEANLAAGLAFSGDGLSDSDAAAAVEDYINKFAARERRRRSTDLTRRIKRAEIEGDDSALALLLREKSRLMREN